MEYPIQFSAMIPINMTQTPLSPEKNWEFLLVWVNMFQNECKMLDKTIRLMFSMDNMNSK
jgi:hypothetical protein